MIPQPIPFIAAEWAIEIGLIMALRIFWLAVVYRDFSSLYRARQELAKEYSHALRPAVGTTLAMRSFFYYRPGTFLILFISLSSIMFGYMIYVLERVVQPLAFNFPISLYLAFETQITGYAT